MVDLANVVGAVAFNGNAEASSVVSKR